jgi:recombinational DNA repair protein RecR
LKKILSYTKAIIAKNAEVLHCILCCIFTDVSVVEKCTEKVRIKNRLPKYEKFRLSAINF